jgi:hypothetical protein
MKTLLFLIGLFFFTIIFGQQQESIESIKKENSRLKEQLQSFKKDISILKNDTAILKSDTTVLRKKLSICDLYSKPANYSITNSGKMDFKFVSCNYNIKSKKVRIDFILINPLSDKNIHLHYCEAFDDFNNKYISVAFQREKKDNDYSFLLLSDTPVKGFIEFNDVLPGVDYFKLIKISYADESFHDIEIRNYKITK